MNSISKWAMALTLVLPMTVQAQSAVQPVVQRGYDANVSGANVTEFALNAANVGLNTFGRLFNLPVDERIYAQPLYVPNVAIPNLGSRNVLYVATMNDTLYAFDADVGGAPFWSVNLASLFNTTAPLWANFALAPNNTQVGHLGILSTPVIDLTTNIMYVVACTLENSTMAYRLHAIDITSGAEPYGPGVLVTANYSGIMLGTPYLLQRMSLALADNQVVVGFSGMQTEYPLNYVGWVLAYDKWTLAQSGVFATETTGNLQGGVWQSGRPPAVDSSGYVYVFTGNTKSGGWNGTTDFSESALKLDPSHGLALVDWFTVGNWHYLDNNDLDLSSSGPLLIPGTSLLTGGGKTGDLYVLNTANLGHWTVDDSQVVQKVNITGGLEIQGGPVYWGGSTATGGPLIYDWADGDLLKSYAFNGSTFATSPSAQSAYIAVAPGGYLALSANGNARGSGVLWASTPPEPKATPPVVAALHAFNAENITQELWNSTMNASRDGFGYFAHSVPPMVANGKVYMATASDHVSVYGLLSDTVLPTSLAFGDQTTGVASAAKTVTVTNISATVLSITGITVTGTNLKQFSQTNNCGSSVAIGATCTIKVVFKPTTTGGKSAQLNVDAGTAGAQTVALSGTGTAPPFTVLPTSLAFGYQTTGVASAAKAVTLTNIGAAALSIAGITFTGTNELQFSQTNNCGSSVASGAKCTIKVVFTPKTTGAKSAQLNVVSATEGTQIVTLSGTGS